MRLTLTTAPATEPLTLADAKLQTHVDGTAEDDLITSFIASARSEAETRTGRALITQTWTLYLDHFPESGEIDLPRPPLQSVTSVQYIDTDGVLTTLATSEYTVDTSGELGRVHLAYDKSWPDVRIERNAVRVEYVAGYGAASDVPEDIRSWCRLRVGDLYAHREGSVTGTVVARHPFADNLLDAYSVLF